MEASNLERVRNYPTLENLMDMYYEDMSPITDVNHTYKMSTHAALHCKYMNICAYINQDYNRLQRKKSMLYAKLERFHTGKSLDGEEFMDKNLQCKVKSELPKLISWDKEYISICKQIDDLTLIQDYAKNALIYITNQSYSLNKFFDVIKYSGG
jgi:hypothetical protein